MKRFRSRHFRRVLVPLMAVSLLSACTRWKVQEMAPAQVVTEKEPGKVRLTMLDGDKIVLRNPWVSDGEIVDYWAERSDTLRVPTDSVARIEIRETDVLAIEIVVTSVLLLAAGVVIWILNIDDPD